MVLISDFSEEVLGQPESLEKFTGSRFYNVPRGSIFVGTGDSYAAALAGFYTSKGQCLALDPYYLSIFPETALGKDVVFISASGRTHSNLVAARKVRKVAKTIVALTADEESRLASAADTVVRLPMVLKPRLPGALSFSLSLLAVLKMLGVNDACDFQRAQKQARRSANEVAFSKGKGITYFLGNGAAHSIALYSAAKVYELLGKRAFSETLEEFSHLELFSLRMSDTVNIYSCFDALGKGEKLQKALTARGYTSSLIETMGDNDTERLFHAVFVAQFSVLRKAKAAGLSRPNFLLDKARLKISDTMIY